MKSIKRFLTFGGIAALMVACGLSFANGQSIDQLQGKPAQPKPEPAEAKGGIVGKWHAAFSDGKGGTYSQTLTFAADGGYHVIDVDANGKKLLESTGKYTFKNGEVNITFSGGETTAWYIVFPTPDSFANLVTRCSWNQEAIGGSARFQRVKG